MKRLFTLIALLGLLGVFTGCNQGTTTTPDTGSTTNAPSGTETTTNK